MAKKKQMLLIINPRSGKGQIRTKHIFSHVEWHMKGYRIRLSGGIPESYISAGKEELKSVYALPGAFGRYTKLIK